MRYILLLFSILPVFIFAQNVGVGTTNPTEKLEVDGKIKITNPQGVQGAGGIIFPDNTFQKTAYNPVPVDGGGGVLFPDGTFQNTAYVANNNPPSTIPGKIAIMIPGYQGPLTYHMLREGFNLETWSVGMTNSGDIFPGGGGGAGQVTYQEVSFTRYIDRWSARIQDDLAQGRPISEITIFTFAPCNDDNGPCYYTIETFENCLWTSYYFGGNTAPESIIETVSFVFGKRRVRVYDLNFSSGNAPDGTFSYIESCWDIVQNLPCNN